MAASLPGIFGCLRMASTTDVLPGTAVVGLGMANPDRACDHSLAVIACDTALVPLGDEMQALESPVKRQDY
jgi:hypothetical protein